MWSFLWILKKDGQVAEEDDEEVAARSEGSRQVVYTAQEHGTQFDAEDSKGKEEVTDTLVARTKMKIVFDTTVPFVLCLR